MSFAAACPYPRSVDGIALVVLGAMILHFLIRELLPIPVVPPSLAIIGASLALLVIYQLKVEPVGLALNDVDWKTLLFLTCMFMMVEAFTKTGILHSLSRPRGIGALGYTQQLPTEDRYLMTKKELLGKIDVLLGGRMAEDVAFGEISTGAHNDLQRATDIARAMTLEYGMGKTLGLSTYPRRSSPMFLNTQQVPLVGKEYSEATASKLDEEVKELISERAETVRALLSEKRALLDQIAMELLQLEVLEAEKFYEIIDKSGLSETQGREILVK